MFKRIPAFIVSGILFLSFPFLAFASTGTFTASSPSYDSSSHVLSFHGASEVTQPSFGVLYRNHLLIPMMSAVH